MQEFIENCLSSNPIEVVGSNIIFRAPTGVSEEWMSQQSASISRYQSEDYEKDATLGYLFGGFISTTVEKNEIILDIGCGLLKNLPHYAAYSGFSKFLGLEPLPVLIDRSFPCIVGASAESLPLKTDSIGSAIFATSLDHIENARDAINEVVRVLKPGGSLYFWLGVHDPEILAEAKSFGNIINRTSGIKRLIRIIGAHIEYANLFIKMYSRKRKLDRGEPLDKAHCRYHTLAGIDAEFKSYNLSIYRLVIVPGSTSVFVEAKGLS